MMSFTTNISLRYYEFDRITLNNTVTKFYQKFWLEKKYELRQLVFWLIVVLTQRTNRFCSLSGHGMVVTVYRNGPRTNSWRSNKTKIENNNKNNNDETNNRYASAYYASDDSGKRPFRTVWKKTVRTAVARADFRHATVRSVFFFGRQCCYG